MALNPEDFNSGFRHENVLTFINKQMARHWKGPEFYLENLSMSWEEVEDKLKGILEDTALPSEAHEACTWGSLALGVRFAYRQGLLHGHRVRWLHDFASMHKCAAQNLAADLKQLTGQLEMERKEAAFQLQLTQVKLSELQKERDLMRMKLFHAVRLPLDSHPTPAPHPHNICVKSPEHVSAMPTSLQELKAASEAGKLAMANTTATAEGIRETGKKEEVAVNATGESRSKIENGVAAMVTACACSTPETTVETDGSLVKNFEGVYWKNYPMGFQQGVFRSIGTSMYSLSGPLDHSSTTESINVQLPDSFTYSYENLFPVTPTPSPPPHIVTEPQMPSYFMASDMNLPSDRKDYGPHEHKKIFRGSGDWECPWCKTVSVSLMGNCSHCGWGI
uniref:testis-expressed protein 13B n=1 Tax=Jaculus jaculus TaxID=51337 RepID=UPI001E1B214E|nr:testis-expressed protein 13B [Jaculus jaculus]